MTPATSFPHGVERACVYLRATSSVRVRNWYPSPRFRTFLMGKVNRWVARGKAWNRAENMTKEGAEGKERISIPYTKHPDVNRKKILNGYLTGSHRRKAWRNDLSIVQHFSLQLNCILYIRLSSSQQLTQGIFIIKIEVGFVTICWDCRFPIKGGGIPYVCTIFAWLLNII